MNNVAPKDGIEKSSFFEDIGSRGLEQMMEVLQKLYDYKQAEKHFPRGHAELDNSTMIDGSLIDAVRSMYWANYRDRSIKPRFLFSST